MKIMILGANGFTGRRILRRLTQRKEHTLFACSLHPDILAEEGYRFETLDMLDYIATDTLLNEFRPEVIVNASALSVVDYCEQHPEEAFAMNVSAVKHLAEYCQAHGCRLIHLSTDFVFDGTQTKPYTETDTANPVNYYVKNQAMGRGSHRADMQRLCHRESGSGIWQASGWTAWKHRSSGKEPPGKQAKHPCGIRPIPFPHMGRRHYPCR